MTATAAQDHTGGTGGILSTRGLTKRFPGVLALDGVDFDLSPGEVHALVGENGAGKSTLIKVLTGVHAADAGEVRYRGEAVRFETPLRAQRAGISTIYQEVNLIPLLSVARNLFLGREPRRFGLIDFPRMHREAARILRDYGVDVDVTGHLDGLSMGARQMVALARAVVADARVVIMDEPTSSLEPREVETLFSVIGTLRERGITVIYVSHRLDELYRICDRVTVLRDGRVVHTGAMAGLERLRLISLMLGREMDQVERQGATTFGGAHEQRSAEPVLVAEGLDARQQLHGVSLRIHQGEVLGLGGLLGSGRTETARAIAGALPLRSGRVSVAGVPLRRRSTAAAIAAGISMLPEDRKSEGIIPELSVRENIALAAMPRLSRFGLVSERRIDSVVDVFVKRLRIKSAGTRQKVSELSGGNQQKVLLARWLALNPKVLLLDEPTRGIDVGAKAEVQRLIDELAAEGLGVMLISSDLEELIEGSDRVVVLKDGGVVGELAGDEVTEGALMQAIAEADGGGPGDPGDPDAAEEGAPAATDPGGVSEHPSGSASGGRGSSSGTGSDTQAAAGAAGGATGEGGRR
ncbi:sugar ABC transporter ATP-binding protein [Streptomonospora litoralis]|uniref:Ribose import ATP-binding protein RbsA n=1 Tax=Streptomonospora litoralis TaxID=2498135 RepID=A0A4P6Q6G5_9ACTN|nr:sugar ABC transporter ATP-binding protein [Streptomonospora litoralis]QBI56315.1 Ribose import ATP-binding protein RbsA [Streptomonospora litoralis]